MTKQTILRNGITTGTCAAAAAKAALLAYYGEPQSSVDVMTPQGKVLTVPVASSTAFAGGGCASVIKDAGDDPDITNGATIVAHVSLSDATGIRIQAGEGVGTVTKPGLSAPVGAPAINPGPLKMIQDAMQRVLHPGHGADVVISIPGGEQLAARTLNPTLGIVGGLSIIGTTGIVEPMSEDAFKRSLTPQISVVRALGHDQIVFVPGRIGQDIAIGTLGLPAPLVVQTSNFIGYMLESAVKQGIKQVLLVGHLGKIVKVAAGVFHTHNRMADARMETIAAYIGEMGAPAEAIREILAATTTEAAMPILSRYGLAGVYSRLAERASMRAERYTFGDLTVGTVIVTLRGEILAMDNKAKIIGGSLNWNNIH